MRKYTYTSIVKRSTKTRKLEQININKGISEICINRWVEKAREREREREGGGFMKLFYIYINYKIIQEAQKKYGRLKEI